MMEEDNELVIRASTGRFEGQDNVDALFATTSSAAAQGGAGGKIQIEQGGDGRAACA